MGHIRLDTARCLLGISGATTLARTRSRPRRSRDYAVVNGRFSSSATGGAAINLSGLRGDAFATLFYVVNWHAVLTRQSYFTQFSSPSPLQHTWSLAIEEQFYLIRPQ